MISFPLCMDFLKTITNLLNINLVNIPNYSERTRQHFSLVFFSFQNICLFSSATSSFFYSTRSLANKIEKGRVKFVFTKKIHSYINFKCILIFKYIFLPEKKNARETNLDRRPSF